MLILGLDPGLGTTGWGVIAADGNRLGHVANGHIRTDPKLALPARLVELHRRLGEVLGEPRHLRVVERPELGERLVRPAVEHVQHLVRAHVEHPRRAG